MTALSCVRRGLRWVQAGYDTPCKNDHPHGLHEVLVWSTIAAVYLSEYLLPSNNFPLAAGKLYVVFRQEQQRIGFREDGPSQSRYYLLYHISI